MFLITLLIIQYFYVVTKVMKLQSFYEYVPKVSLYGLDLLTSFLTFLILIVLIETFFKKKWIRTFCFFLLSFSTGFLYAYFRKTGVPLDPVIIMDNFDLVGKSGADSVLGSFLDKRFIERSLLYPILILVFSFFLKDRPLKKLKKIKPAYFILPLVFLISLNRYPIYPVFSFAKDAIKSSLKLGNPQNGSISPKKYEFSSANNSLNKYNIIILFLESFNGTYVNEKTEDNREITPLMNSLYQRNLSSRFHFSNSIQTVKGQFSLLCGLYPLNIGKASYSLDGKKLNCLPKVLSKIGYKSLFYKSYTDDSFDNTKVFFKDVGFDSVENPKSLGIDQSIINSESLAWGIKDSTSYKIFISEIEKKFSEKTPFLAVMTTLSHHMPFELPREYRLLFTDEKGREESFLNSLHLSDKYLETFIQEYENSSFKENTIVVITGDHSFPNGRNGSFFNEKGASEDNFKVPFVLMLPKELKEKFSIKKHSTSHVDVMVSLLNLIGIKQSEFGHGSSIFEIEKEPLVLVQPYNGEAIKVISENKKYIWFSKNNILLKGKLDNDSSPYFLVKDGDSFVEKTINSYYQKVNFLLENYSLD